MIVSMEINNQLLKKHTHLFFYLIKIVLFLSQKYLKMDLQDKRNKHDRILNPFAHNILYNVVKLVFRQ